MLVLIVDENEEERRRAEEAVRRVSPEAKIITREYLDHELFPGEFNGRRRLRVKTFGEFAMFADDKPVKFRYSKSQELFALLVDRRGKDVDNRIIRKYLWQDNDGNMDHSSYISALRKDIRQVMSGLDISGIFRKKGGQTVSLIPESVQCDYYDYIAGKKNCVPFEGRYMEQYSWAESTVGLLYSIAEFRKKTSR